MELIGKKTIRQSAFAKSTTSKMSVGKGRLKFSGAAVRGMHLADKEIGIGYDESGNYVYIAEEGAGNKVKDNGEVATMYHSKTLLEKFGIVEDTAEFLVSSIPADIEQYPDMEFFRITPMSEETGVDADSVLEKEEIPVVDARESEFMTVPTDEVTEDVETEGDIWPTSEGDSNLATDEEVVVPEL